MNGVDAKHRLSVPAPLRDTIEARSQTKAVVLGPSDDAPCLIGYDLSYFARMEERLAAQFAGDFGPGRATKARSMFGLTEQMKYDDTGRIILSPVMRDLGEINGRVVFLGVGDYFEIWSPDVLMAQEGQDPRVQRVVKALLAGKAG